MSCSHQKPFLTAVELSIGYKKKPVLDGISFDLRRGDIFAVVGHNGSGKTTLIKTILGILPPISGETLWATNNPADKSYLGQIADFDRRFPARVIDLAIMGGWSKLSFFGRANKNLKDRAYDALIKTGIDHIAERPIHELSSGQLQRALFARAIVQDAQCILLDEPFNAVDQATEEKLLELIIAWANQGRVVMLVLHDLTTVLRHANKALLVGRGKAQFGPPRRLLIPEKLVEQGYLSSNQVQFMRSLYTDQYKRKFGAYV